MNEHSNDQLSIGDLPSLEDIDWVEVDRNLIVRDVIRNLIISTGLLVATLVGGFGFLSAGETIFSLIGIIYICVGLFVIVLLILWPRLEFPHRGYALRELDIAQRRGFITRYLATEPFSRVQHVAVSQGVLDRMFSLATLQIYTAGGVSSIKGFHVDNAHQLREHILERVAEINLAASEEFADEATSTNPTMDP
ncbi:MAG: PH domain-containing protein [Gammaproteobacteria bacterium]|nr:PH domain-containing protein [Gammaproteobacteria bacterium]MYF38487.1 PH domain-containing protein [Gammaproteobacteria bacterium]